MTRYPTAWARRVERYPATGKELTPSARHLLLLIATHCHKDGHCAVLVSTLAAEMGYTGSHAERTVRRHLGALRTGGLVATQQRRRRSSVTVLLMPAQDEAAPASSLDTDTPAPATAVTPVPEVVIPVPVEAAALTASDLRDDLIGSVLEGHRIDYGDDIVGAFRVTLAEARALGRDYSYMSANLTGYLVNAVIGAAVVEFHDGIEDKDLSRLYKQAKVIGSDGPEWIVKALAQTAASSIDDNAASYVAATAGKLAAKHRAKKAAA